MNSEEKRVSRELPEIAFNAETISILFGDKTALSFDLDLFSLFFLNCQIGKRAIREASRNGQQSEVNLHTFMAVM